MDIKEEGAAAVGFRTSDLTDGIVGRIAQQLGLELVSWRLTEMEGSQGFHTTLAQKFLDPGQKIIGHQAIKIEGKCVDSGELNTRTVILKSKEIMTKTTEQMVAMCNMLNPSLGAVVPNWNEDPSFPITTNHLREIRIAERTLLDPVLAAIQPKVYFTLLDEDKEQFVLVSEYLDPKDFTHVDAIEGGCGIEQWDEDSVVKVLTDMAQFHAAFFNREEEVNGFLGCQADMIRSWSKQKQYITTFQQLMMKDKKSAYSAEQGDLIMKMLHNYDEIFKVLNDSKKTLIHFDFTPKNLRMRRSPKVGEKNLCVYDWEMAHLGPPQQDIVEFLGTVLPVDPTCTRFLKYIEIYRLELQCALSRETGTLADDVTESCHFMKVFDFNVMAYVLGRFPIYFMIMQHVDIPYYTRLAKNLLNYLTLCKGKYDFLH